MAHRVIPGMEWLSRLSPVYYNLSKPLVAGYGANGGALLVMAFAVTQASRWAADEEEGRQDLVLVTPQPRLRVILARFGALTTATVLIGVLTLALTALSGRAV